MLTIQALAKINLTLEVLGIRPDGYHDIRSIVQAIGLCDTLEFNNSDDIIIHCDMPGWSAEKSLVSRAVALVHEASGVKKGVKLDIKKRIPLMSGLGGDSSDAAAVLKGLKEFWDLGFTPGDFYKLAAELGSDVFFFLECGTALVEGRGEIVKNLAPLSPMWAVIVVPGTQAGAGKTAGMYAALEPSHYTDGHITERFVDMLADGPGFDFSLLFNTFENIALKNNTSLTCKEHLLKLGAPHVHLCGSGPALFTLFDDRSAAEELYTRCRNQGMEAYLAGTL